MNHVIQNPIGLDGIIQQAQETLYGGLLTAWGDIGLEGFGRVYKNPKDGKLIPEYYETGHDYSGSLLDKSSKFFFTKADVSDRDGLNHDYSTKVNIYFIVDLSKAKPSATHRAVMDVQKDVLWALEITNLFPVRVVDTGIENVFSEFTGAVDMASFDDMHPFHVFRVECDTKFDYRY